VLEKLKKIAPTLPQFATHKAKPVVSVLNQYSAYRISGDDAETFLQGQLSNDVKQLIDGHHGQLTSYCTPKGRMLAIFYLVRLANDYIAIMPSAIAETVFQRLQMFIMRSKVEINALVDNCSLLGLHQADSLLSQELTPSANAYASASQGNNLSLRISSQPSRLLVLASDQLATELSNDESLLASNDHWHLADIEAGIPNLFAETQECFVPQMTNLELIDGVNFRKGCYPGQEVVARLHYLGTAKRRMYGLAITASEKPEINASLFDEGSEQAIGSIVNAVELTPGNYKALAVLRVEHANSDLLHTEYSSHIEQIALPYSLANENETEDNTGET
jgi:folate-binding protein YgfZ